MKKVFSTSEQVESFLLDKGVDFRRFFCKQPVTQKQVPYWQVKVGKTYCEIYDLVTWANTVHSR